MNPTRTTPPVALIILDGFGHAPDNAYNAITQAYTPHLSAWIQRYPHTLLHASGESVGLLPHTAGNSEVGHLTIGCGRVVSQPIKIIHDAIDDGSFFTNPLLATPLQALARSQKTLHIMGLLSDGGVHTQDEHFYAFIKAATAHHIHKIVVHPFLDGRDVPPRSATHYLTKLEQHLALYNNSAIGSLHGRFYAMDRDQNWDRTQRSYNTLIGNQKATHAESHKHDWRTILNRNYDIGVSDEFVPPILLDPSYSIQPGDGIIFCNYRPDRARQLTAAFMDHDFTHFTRPNLPLSFFMTPVPYYDALDTIALFSMPPISQTLKQILAHAEKTIFSIAETEKYAHVTYFFDGFREKPFSTETRILVPSLHTKTYAHHPHMSAQAITDTVIHSLNTQSCDFYLINYANPDMVGHSGDLKATIAAIEFIDTQLGLLHKHIVQKKGGTLYITADHGKAETMRDLATNQPYTAHTTNKVPFIVVAPDNTKVHDPTKLTTLADIAPYILTSMNIPVPPEMYP